MVGVVGGRGRRGRVRGRVGGGLGCEPSLEKARPSKPELTQRRVPHGLSTGCTHQRVWEMFSPTAFSSKNGRLPALALLLQPPGHRAW